MDLVKKETGGSKTTDVELEALLKPANAFVISTVPLIATEEKQADLELKAVGTVAYDTRQSGAIASRVNGRIEKLYIRHKYQPITKGQKIMEVYSPELATAQQNLLFLLRNDPENRSLIQAAGERLRLLGMTQAQVAQVMQTRKLIYSVPVFSNFNGYVTDINSINSVPEESMQLPPAGSQQLSVREGMYVQAGQSVFAVYDPSRAWVLLEIFPEQQLLVKEGDAVKLVPETAPENSFSGKIDYLEPVFRTGNKTLTARVYFNNAARRLPIGARVTASIFTHVKNAAWLPKEAVLALGRDRIVFKKETGGFRAVPINTGVELERHIQVTGGLKPSDSVAVNAQFLIDNEAFIKVNEP
jgi:Cu(I)/Ag(I) efflux system membrane fusion protein